MHWKKERKEGVALELSLITATSESVVEVVTSQRGAQLKGVPKRDAAPSIHLSVQKTLKRRALWVVIMFLG